MFPNTPPCLCDACCYSLSLPSSPRLPACPGSPLSRVQTWRCRLYWKVCGQWKLDSPQMRFLRSYFRSSAPGATGRRIPRDRQRQGLWLWRGQQKTLTPGKEFTLGNPYFERVKGDAAESGLLLQIPKPCLGFRVVSLAEAKASTYLE